MITEWSFPALDAGLPCNHGAGQRVPTQRDRALAFTAFQKLLFRTLGELRDGTLAADIARTVGYLAAVTARVTETVELDRRVDRLESTILARANSREPFV